MDVDTAILKRIREKIEGFEQEELEVERHRNQYLTEEERAIDEMNTVYKQQDEEYVKVSKEVEDELKKEGFLEDGSNITEEDIAKSYGMTTADYLAQNKKGGALQEAREQETTTTTPTPASILSEKEDLLNELESPKKSFSEPLFTKAPAPKPAEVAPIAPDHQLENTHVEEPFHDEINTVVKAVEPVKAIPTPVEVAPTPVKPAEVEPIETNIAPIIKKPAKIDLTHDVYREPIE